MTGKFSNQGTLLTTGTILHTAPDNNMSEVRSLRFNNTLAYTLTLVKYPSATQIYSLTLSGGDTLSDDTLYHLDENEYLEATSSIVGTTFITEGEDMPNINVVRCR